MLIFSSCSKEQVQTQSYQVEEYFAENKQEVREKVYNFLLAADRLEVAAKDAVAFTNQDPNEGVWLMEAAVNAEKVGHLDETTVDSKTITLEIQNEINEAGEIEMKASDVLSKYNTLLSEIEANEIDGKNAQLIDLKVETVDPAITRIRTDILYGKVNPEVIIELEDEDDPSASLCSYNWDGTDYVTILGDWSQSFTYNRVIVYPNGISDGEFEGDLLNNIPSDGPNSFAWYFNALSKQLLYHNYPIPVNSSLGITIDPNLSQGYTPYTNVILKNKSELEDIVGCVNVYSSNISYNSLIWDDAIDSYHQMIYEVESTLPNSQYRGYAPVYGNIKTLQGSHSKLGVAIFYLGFIYENND